MTSPLSLRKSQNNSYYTKSIEDKENQPPQCYSPPIERSEKEWKQVVKKEGLIKNRTAESLRDTAIAEMEYLRFFDNGEAVTCLPAQPLSSFQPMEQGLIEKLTQPKAADENSARLTSKYDARLDESTIEINDSDAAEKEPLHFVVDGKATCMSLKGNTLAVYTESFVGRNVLTLIDIKNRDRARCQYIEQHAEKNDALTWEGYALYHIREAEDQILFKKWDFKELSQQKQESKQAPRQNLSDEEAYMRFRNGSIPRKPASGGPAIAPSGGNFSGHAYNLHMKN